MQGPIGWRDTQPVLLLNPRLPSVEQIAYENAWKSEVERRKSKRLSLDIIGIATSGTSGNLKLVVLTRSAFLASAVAVNEHLDSDGNDIWLKTIPEFHVGGLSIFARAFVNGATVIDVVSTGDKFWDAHVFTKQLTETKATLTSLVPAHVFSIVQERLNPPPSLRAAVVGGGALAPGLYLQARELGWPILPSYGLTECCSQVATVPLATLRRPKTEMPSPEILNHVEARTTGDGFLEIKSAALLEGYIKIPTTTEKLEGATFEDPKTDGWLRTEDKVEIQGGKLNVRGRESDFIKIGGESVDFARLSRRLEDLRATRKELPDVALIPFPDERLGFVVQLVCAANAPPSGVRELVQRYNELVAPFERIREIRFVSAIPRSSLGKLLRNEVVRLLQREI